MGGNIRGTSGNYIREEEGDRIENQPGDEHASARRGTNPRNSRRAVTHDRANGFDGTRYVDAGLSGIVGIVGQPGTGKSFLMSDLIRQCRRVIVVDTVHQYGNGPRQNKLPGFVPVQSLRELIAYWSKVRQKNFRICYKPGMNLEAEFDGVARLTLEVRDCVFAIDEVWNYCEAGWMPPPLEFMARAGRHRGITTIYTGQRPAIIAADLRSVTNHWKIFRMKSQLDLKAMQGLVPPEALARVPSLPDRVHITSNDSFDWKEVGR